MPRKPPKPTTAYRMLLDILLSTRSSTWPIFWPDLFFTAVPMTFFARIAEVWPDGVVIAVSFAVFFTTAHGTRRVVLASIGELRTLLSADAQRAVGVLAT